MAKMTVRYLKVNGTVSRDHALTDQELMNLEKYKRDHPVALKARVEVVTEELDLPDNDPDDVYERVGWRFGPTFAEAQARAEARKKRRKPICDFTLKTLRLLPN